MAELDLLLKDGLAATPPEWLNAVLADFDAFLQDHASAEKKASGMALNLAAHYPDQTRLLQAMVDLAVEELGHYREVVRLLLARGQHPAPDTRDAYVRALNALVRRGPDVYLLDRLLIAAIVERRGNERFQLLADALPAQSSEHRFYAAIASSEARHWRLFVDLATDYAPADAVAVRLRELIRLEADIVHAQPITAALH